MIEAGKEQHLGRMAFYLLLWRKVIVAIVLFIIALLAAAFSSELVQSLDSILQSAGSATQGALSAVSSSVANLTLGLFLLSIIVFLSGFIVAWLEYQNYTFTFDEFDLRMRKGILYKKEVSIPYRQIQDVDIDRSLAHIVMGLSRVVMQTAGHEESNEHHMTEVVLEPVTKVVGEEVRTMLERRIGVQVTEDEKTADAQTAATAS